MAIRVLNGAFRRYVGHAAIQDALELARNSDYWLNALSDQVKDGLFNYRIYLDDQDPLLGIVHIRHSDILNYLASRPGDFHALRRVVNRFSSCLSNVVQHKPFEEYVGAIASPDARGTSIDTLKSYLEAYPDWIGYLRCFLRNNAFASARRATMLSVALDIGRVIQASQEKHSETNIPSSVEHHDPHQIQGLVLTLHNAILSLNQEEVIRYPIPETREWVRLIHAPDATASCAPDGYFLPLPSISVIEQIASETKQWIPSFLAISPDSDTLVKKMREASTSLDWGVVAHPGFQTILVRSPDDSRRIMVYSVALETSMIYFSGTLDPLSAANWEKALGDMIDLAQTMLTGHIHSEGGQIDRALDALFEW